MEYNANLSSLLLTSKNQLFMNKQGIQVHLGQPQGVAFNKLSEIAIGKGEEFTVDQLRDTIQKHCFMVKLLTPTNPNGVLIPIGYDMPEFLTLDSFKDWAKAKPEEDGLEVVTESLLHDAEKAELAHCNTAFKSLCTYGFTHSQYVNPASPVKAIGVDDEGKIYLRHVEQEYLVV